METNAARDRIFARIRAAQGRGASVTEGERAAVADYLERHPQGPQPAITAGLAEAFTVQAQKMASTVDRVAMLSDVPAAVARYLDGLQLSRRAVAWTALGDLPWAAQGLSVECRPPLRDAQADHDHGDLVGITGCFAAIAETGSLMLLSGPDTYASAALLPETHIAVVPVPRIVANLEAAFARMRAEHGQLPRATNIISGPSRTGDIEQTIVLGAHGPYRVHVVLVGDEGG
ncbi:LutC/YkgG family protein [Cupriavidus agavae]|uniref:L-lactate dehydrogenase complex protein LldG n=1 Tax=Cupriavidus agavae TaxID=1001822 RepID=A0A4Q7S5K3_9BURK|nr:lactate utilization protein C [Cupriavidus agavae]RZT41615.1 L-lactate dehydrogenase complex protein LldG [Cupriavidus agavae]